MTECATQGALTNADLWRFGVMPLDLADAVTFFRSPRWSVPGRVSPVLLLDESER